MIKITCKRGYVLTDDQGNIIEDHVGRDYVRPPDPSWRIVGFSTRFNAAYVIPLADAVRGVSIGQGWVHDIDHGTHRMWGNPTWRRAVKVEKVAEDGRNGT